MIEELTLDQQARFPEFVDKWTRIGLSTEPADRPLAEQAIRMVYECGGVKPPNKVIWFGSPKAMIEASSNYKNPVRDSVLNSVLNSVSNSVLNSVSDSVSDSVRDLVWNSVYDSVYTSIWGSVSDSVWDPVPDSVWNSM